MKKEVVVNSLKELTDLIKKEIELNGSNCDLNHLNVSQLNSLKNLFSDKDLTVFNGDISKWDVSNVTNMNSMFSYSVFEQDLSNWDVVKVGTMLNIFDDCNVSAWWANPDLGYEERLDILQKLQH